MTRHFGAFIQNILKPIIEEADKVLGKCKNLHLTKKNICEIIHILLKYEIIKSVIYSITYIMLGILGCLTVYFILR